MLLNSVLPELRLRGRERGVFVVESDPLWEISLTPGRSGEIIAARLEELHGHRPIFIAILGTAHAASQARAQAPWLKDMDSGMESLTAMKFVEQVMDNQLMRERAFFYIPGDPDTPPGDGHPAALEKLRTLRSAARDGRFLVRDRLSSMKDLEAAILQDLLAILDRLHPPGEHLSLLGRWRRSQELFAASHRRSYVEFPGYFDRLDNHVAGDGVPLFLTGEGGTGKSALLANWMAYARSTTPAVPVIGHHVGAVAAENDLASVLRHIMSELKELYAISEQVPDSLNAMVAALPLWLERLRDKRMVLVIDGLDQLQTAARSLDWLPSDISPNLRLVVSTATSDDAGREIFERLVDRDWDEFQMKPLKLAQKRMIIDRMVSDTGNDLGADLLQRFTLVDTAFTPLLIHMSVREIQQTQSDGERDKLLTAQTHEEFFERIFERLENNHGRDLVADVMSLIWGTRTGLHIAELRQMNNADPEALARFLDAIDHYLSKRDTMLSFAHEHIRQEVQRRYLSSTAQQLGIHRRLAQYFASEPTSLRRATEEPWQWEHAGERGRLAACLSDIPMFNLLWRSDRRHELREYWVQLNDEKMLVESYEASFAAWRSRVPDAEEHAAMAEHLGTFFMASGLMERAEKYIRRALLLKEGLYGSNHIETAATLHTLAELLRQQGKFAEAEGYYRSALGILEGAPEPASLTMARVLSDLGLLYRDWGRHQFAFPFYQKAIELKERVCGADHPETAESLNDLALLYHDLHDFAMAIPLYKRALDIRQRRLGPNHPITATSLNNLAGSYRADGNLDESETLYYRALSIQEKMLGHDHPSTLTTMANVASILQARKKFPESVAMFTRAITSAVIKLGQEHPMTIGLRISSAYPVGQSGDYQGAERILREALTLAVQTLGATHPYVGICANNLGSLLLKMGRDDEAAPLYAQAIAAWEVSLGPDHPDVADAVEVLGAIYLRQNDLDAAERCARRAMAIQVKLSGPDQASPRTLVDMLEKIRSARDEHSRI